MKNRKISKKILPVVAASVLLTSALSGAYVSAAEAKSETVAATESISMNDRNSGKDNSEEEKTPESTLSESNLSKEISTSFGKVKKTVTPVKDKKNEWEIKTEIISEKKDNKTDTILVIDTSGNMSYGNRMKNAKEKAKKIAEEILKKNNGETKNENRVGIVSFNGYVKEVSALTDKIEDIKTKIDKLYTAWYWEDGAFTQKAIKTARDMLKNSQSVRNKNIVILSYGKSTYGYPLADNKKAEDLRTESVSKVDLTKRILGVPWRHERKSNGLLVLDFLTLKVLKTENLNEEDFNYNKWIGNGDDEHAYFDLKTSGNSLAQVMAKKKIKEHIYGFEGFADRIAKYVTDRYDYKYYDLGYNAIAEAKIAEKNGINVYSISVETPNEVSTLSGKNKNSSKKNADNESFGKYLKEMAANRNYYESVPETIGEKLANKAEDVKINDEVNREFEISSEPKDLSEKKEQGENKIIENEFIKVKKGRGLLWSAGKDSLEVDISSLIPEEGKVLSYTYRIKLKGKDNKKLKKLKPIESVLKYKDGSGEHQNKFEIGEVEISPEENIVKSTEASKENTEVTEKTEPVKENTQAGESENKNTESEKTGKETVLPREKESEKEVNTEEKTPEEHQSSEDTAEKTDIEKTESEENSGSKTETTESSVKNDEEDKTEASKSEKTSVDNETEDNNTEKVESIKTENEKTGKANVSEKVVERIDDNKNSSNPVYGRSGNRSERTSAVSIRGGGSYRMKGEVYRTGGIDRFETAVKISVSDYRSADTVILSNAYKYTDILSAAPYANIMKAPILYTNETSVPSATLNEIKRLGAKNIVIIGGEKSINASVENILEKEGYTISRVGGSNRYDTAKSIAEKIIKAGGRSDEVIVAAGNDFPDALAISTLANRDRIPVLLTEKDKTNKWINELLKEKEINKLHIAGGEMSVSDRAVQEIMSASKVHSVFRYAGKNRYETAALIAEKVLGSSNRGTVVSGEVFADALAASTHGFKNNAPILLTEKGRLSAETEKYVKNRNTKKIEIVGGKITVSGETEKTIRDLVEK